MGAIAADSTLAGEMATRLLGNDQRRQRMVETVLADDRSAQYVLARIGRSPTAVDYVLQAAFADSASREHMMVLLERMRVALKSTKKK
jgi:hypothetical protein